MIATKQAQAVSNKTMITYFSAISASIVFKGTNGIQQATYLLRHNFGLYHQNKIAFFPGLMQTV